MHIIRGVDSLPHLHLRASACDTPRKAHTITHVISTTTNGRQDIEQKGNISRTFFSFDLVASTCAHRQPPLIETCIPTEREHEEDTSHGADRIHLREFEVKHTRNEMVAERESRWEGEGEGEGEGKTQRRKERKREG